MYRFMPICVALLAALATVQPAPAGEASAAEIERMTAQLESLFEPLTGAVEARDLVFRDHGGGFKSLSYPLARAKPSGLDLLSDDPPFRTLAGGHMAGEPLNPAAMVNSVISDLETPYNLWWALVNGTDEDRTRKTAVRVVGPGGIKIDAAEEVLYTASAVHLIWFNAETPFTEPGMYIHRTWVKGAGKVIYRFFAEAAATTTVER